MIARNMAAKIVMDGKDVTADLSPYLKAISYEDNLSGQADTVAIELMDRDGVFIDSWYPPRGSKLTVELMRNNFNGDGRSENLKLGEFEVDEVANEYPPSTCEIKAVSIAQNSGLRQNDESKSYENVKLSEIAQETASNSGVELLFKAQDDPLIERAECGEQSRLAFLEKLCSDNDLCLKFADNTLIIFDETELEAQAAIKIFDRNFSSIIRFHAAATLQDVYKKCVVSYKHGKQDELFEGEYDNGREAGKTLKVNKKVESQAEAEKLARKKLREKNKSEVKLRVVAPGDFELLAGSCVELKNHGAYDGKYLIESARHEVGDGYQVNLTMHKCLEGY